jgi:SpoVK/Ycf46/Vps4 family AAA+-type ATPase
MSDAFSRNSVQVSGHSALLSWLGQLDELLRVVTVAVAEALTPTAVLDPFRGLHITEDDVDRLLRQPPGTSLSEGALAPPRPMLPFPQLERMERTFSLTPFDSAVLLIAVAPEIDLRYERLYGYLQDDVTLRRPTLDLALSLLCPDATTRLTGRRHLSEEGPLRRHGLIALVPVRDRTAMMARALEPDAQVVRLLTGDPGLDQRLTAWAALAAPAASRDLDAEPADDHPAGRAIARILLENQAAVELSGATPAAARRLAARVAAVLDQPLISADPSRTGLAGAALTRELTLLVREAWLHEALLHVMLHGPGAAADRRLLDEALAAFPAEARPCLVSLDAPASGAVLTRLRLPRLSLEVPPPGARERARIWTECLGRAGVQHDADVDLLAARYRMSREQTEAAIGAARGELAWQSAAGSRPSQLTTSDLAAAARIEIRVDLGSLATRIESHRRWGELVVPDDVRDQLREFCDRVTRREQVLDDGGFADRLGPATGVPALFAGPSGSGKTMAAGIVAAELGLDCFKINLASVVSKYIGETEKNLEQVFAAAEKGDLLLLFDECDALFGKRSEVRDARDRYANIEVAYLLQRLESYPGPVILATNLLANLDEAFTRRMAFTIHFPMPGPDERRHIWERIWPGQTRVSADVDAGELARRYALSGGNIRNIAVAGAFLAAGDGSPVTRRHLLHAVRREYQKLGAEPPEVPDA